MTLTAGAISERGREESGRDPIPRTGRRKGHGDQVIAMNRLLIYPITSLKTLKVGT